MSPLWSEKTGHHLLQNLLDQNSIKNYHYCIVQCFECQLFLKFDYCWLWMNFQIGSEIFVLQFSIGDHSRPKKFFLFSCSILSDLNIVKISCVHPRSKCNNLKKIAIIVYFMNTLTDEQNSLNTQSEEKWGRHYWVRKICVQEKSFYKKENLFLFLWFITFENKRIELREKTISQIDS
jgi:hypothetical protein